MAESKRSAWRRAKTFVDFIRQQRRTLPQLRQTLSAPSAQPDILITGGEDGWTGTGYRVRKGDRFRLAAEGHLWLAKPLALVLEPRASLYMRIGGVALRKTVDNDWVYEAWADGEIELLSKGLSEFADTAGNLLPGKRAPNGPGISVRIEPSDREPGVDATPDGWRYLWRIGDGRIYSGDPNDIRVATHGDVGILQSDVDLPLTGDSELSWDWLVEQLPSDLPEDLAFTHDYLSIAVEFDNGRDLTYMWSAGLAEGHVFRCPLNWWCERETHWVLRSGTDGLGRWHSEKRSIAADYRSALGEPLPARIIRVWLIANSVFQRRPGTARFAKISIR